MDFEFIQMTPEQRFEAATRDDICQKLVPSDIRRLLGEIKGWKARCMRAEDQVAASMLRGIKTRLESET